MKGRWATALQLIGRRGDSLFVKVVCLAKSTNSYWGSRSAALIILLPSSSPDKSVALIVVIADQANGALSITHAMRGLP